MKNQCSEDVEINKVHKFQIMFRNLDQEKMLVNYKPPCKVCLQSEGRLALIPCGHAAFCEKCYLCLNQECPMCHRPCIGYLKIHLN